MKKTLLLLLALTAIGCKKVEFADGRIPQQYLSLAKQFEGTYSGQFDGIQGTLTVSFDGDRPYITFSNGGDNDLIGSHCQSKIGQIMWADVSGTEENPELNYVAFAFNPNNCRREVEGRELVLALKNRDGQVQLNAELLYRREYERYCHWDPGAPPHVPPREICEYRDRYVMLYGRFKK